MRSALLTGAVVAGVGCTAALVLSVAAAQPRYPARDSVASSSARAAPTPGMDGPPQMQTAERTSAPISATTHRRPWPPRTPSSTAQQRLAPTTRMARPSSTYAVIPTRPSSASVRVADPVPKPLAGQALPLAYPTGRASRVLTVVAGSTGSTTATLQAWERAPGGGWLKRGGAILAHVGSQGLTTHPSESLSATPIGTFTLTQAFGRATNPGTGLPYFQTGSSDWWVSDVNSTLYNTHQHCTACGFDTGVSENLYGAGYVYTYAVVIDYNRFPVVRGAGSAFFLHVTDGSATAGCVAIPEADLVSIMRWLTPAAQPRILIGVA